MQTRMKPVDPADWGPVSQLFSSSATLGHNLTQRDTSSSSLLIHPRSGEGRGGCGKYFQRLT